MKDAMYIEAAAMPPATPLVLRGNTVLMHESCRNEQTRGIFVNYDTYLKDSGTTSEKQCNFGI